MSIDEANQLLDELHDLSTKGLPCNETIAKLQLMATEFRTLPPSILTPNLKEFIIYRQLLEETVLYQLRQQNIGLFQNVFLQLKSFYLESQKLLPQSQRYYPILSLFLLMLIQENRYSEYYVELERIPNQELMNIYISVPYKIEQYLMEGNYIQLLNSIKVYPMKEYEVFINKLVNTIRNEAAQCFQKACNKLSIEEACKILLLNNKIELEDFMQHHKPDALEAQVEWRITDDTLYFEEINKKKLSINSKTIIELNLLYADQIEKIV